MTLIDQINIYDYKVLRQSQLEEFNKNNGEDPENMNHTIMVLINWTYKLVIIQYKGLN